MKNTIEQLLATALDQLKQAGDLVADDSLKIQVTRTKDEKFGDFATNLAMMLAKPNRKNPRDLATALIAALPDSPNVTKVDIAGAGFINFYVTKSASFAVIPNILQAQSDFGRSTTGAGQKVLVEFVSANPTGPLHVGHGRGAAYGAALSDLLAAAGFDVSREYYVNDAGRQMNILAASVWLRYLELHDLDFAFPANGYRGDYIRDIAANLKALHGKQFVKSLNEVFDGLPKDEAEGGDKDNYIDALIERCRTLLGEAHYRTVFDCGLNAIVDDIRDDLAEFGVIFQNWFSERSLVEDGVVDDCLNRLQQTDYIYEKEGALWFKSTAFGDEKDRVVRRENGSITYFASDIAYHLNKFDRGFDRIVDIFGADHHGYMARIKASMQALMGKAPNFDILLVQFANLYRGKVKVPMSTRAGEFVTLRELRHEVGNDAARFFYIMRRSEQHMDFDLELAKSQSNDNPVYYIQYAHARICSVFRQLAEQTKSHDNTNGLAHLSLLTEPHEDKIIKTLARYPEMIEAAALAAEPHQITYYLRELANDFHSYYNAHMFIVDDDNLRNARLTLIKAVQQVLQNALHLIAVSAPENM